MTPVSLGFLNIGKRTSLFKKDVKIPKAKALLLLETANDKRKVFRSIEDFRTENNLSDADMTAIEKAILDKKQNTDGSLDFDSIDAEGKSIKKHLSAQQVETFTKAEGQAAKAIAKLARLEAAIGKDKFEEGVKLFDTAQENRYNTIKAWIEFATPKSKNSYYTTDDLNIVTAYNSELSTVTSRSLKDNFGNSVAFTPISDTALSDRHLKTAGIINKLFNGAKILFGTYADSTTYITTNQHNQPSVRIIKASNGNTYIMVDNNAFEGNTNENTTKAILQEIENEGLAKHLNKTVRTDVLKKLIKQKRADSLSKVDDPNTDKLEN
jgi:hypothetical protein